MIPPEVLRRCPLFAGIDEGSLEALLGCLEAVRKPFCRDEFVLLAGDRAVAVGVVLSGGVRVVQEDFWGHRMILSHVEPGGLFGEAFSCAADNILPISVVAAGPAEVLFINYRKIVSSCTSACAFHTRLIMNMMRVLADKNIQLTRKMGHLARRTTREKLLSFLSAQAVQAGGSTVELPFNRQELADYLCVDRSALSRELGLMRAQGLIRYEKQQFVLLSEADRAEAERAEADRVKSGRNA